MRGKFNAQYLRGGFGSRANVRVSVAGGELVHDRQQNGRFVQVVVLGIADGRDFFEFAVAADVIDPGRHDHAAAMGERFEELHVVDGCRIVGGGHGAKFPFVVSGRMYCIHRQSPFSK